MSVWLALSCLQGRDRAQAVTTLAALGPDGLQLTPGNPPGPVPTTLPLRHHHGYAHRARKRDVWDGATPLVGGAGWSVHPPERLPDGVDAADFFAAMAAMGVPLEVMPDGVLGTGAAVEAAMAVGVRLAVDVSHVAIQRAAGRMDEATWRRLQAYDHIEEIHVSRADGQHDAHLPLTPDTPGLGWARARTDVPRILECWMHALDVAACAAQLALLRG